MKTLVTFPIIITLGFITLSCGSSPDEEETMVRNLVPTDVLPPIEEPMPVRDVYPAIEVNSAMPIATKVAGRPGFVFNPYNQNMVEVSGMISGTKVRDPQDPDPSHIFIVP